MNTSVRSWGDCETVFEMGEVINQKGKFDSRRWRRFLCLCYRRVWEHLWEEGARVAVMAAERHCDGYLTDEELLLHHCRMKYLSERNWERVRKLCTDPETGKWIWPLNDRVDKAWVDYSAALCGKDVTLSDLTLTTKPDGALQLSAWANTRRMVSDPYDREQVDQMACEIIKKEEVVQIELLRSVFMDID